jgi:hypothetical protein
VLCSTSQSSEVLYSILECSWAGYKEATCGKIGSPARASGSPANAQLLPQRSIALALLYSLMIACRPIEVCCATGHGLVSLTGARVSLDCDTTSLEIKERRVTDEVVASTMHGQHVHDRHVAWLRVEDYPAES